MPVYIIKFTITERYGHKYRYTKLARLTKRQAGNFGPLYERAVFKRYGDKIGCKVERIERVKVHRRGLPTWIKNLLLGLLFWVILLSMLWVAEAPWL